MFVICFVALPHHTLTSITAAAGSELRAHFRHAGFGFLSGRQAGAGVVLGQGVAEVSDDR